MHYLHLVAKRRKENIMLTRYNDPLFSTAFDLFPDFIWASNKQTDTIDKDGIKIEMPGVKPCDLDLTVEGKRLSIKGKSRHGKDFHYSYSLGPTVNLNDISAKLSDGLLEIRLPKKEITPQTRKIQIET